MWSTNSPETLQLCVWTTFFVDCFSLKSSFFTVIVGMTSSSICSAAINTLSLTQHIWVKIFTAKSHLFAKLLTSQLLGNQWENERRKGTMRTLQLGGAPIDLLQESQSRLISDSWLIPPLHVDQWLTDDRSTQDWSLSLFIKSTGNDNELVSLSPPYWISLLLSPTFMF